MSQLLPYSRLHSYLGGIDRLTGEIKGFAFEKATPASVEGAGGATHSLEFNKVESYDQLSKALSVDAKAEARFGLFGADASFSFEKSMSINSYSIFVYAVAKVERAFAQIEDPVYKKAATELVKGAGGSHAFREAYGDWFVRGIATGGELLSLIEIRTKDESERQKIDAALSGSYGVSFSGSANTQSTFESATSNATTHIVQHQVGGTPRTIEKPEDVFVQLIAFRDELSAPVCTTAVAYQIGCVEYSTVPIPDAPSWIELEQAEQNLDMLAQRRSLYMRALADVQYVLLNQNEFVWDKVAQAEWVKSLNQLSTVLTTNLEIVQKNAGAIARDVAATLEPLNGLVEIPSIELPPRQLGLPAPEVVTQPPADTQPATPPSPTPVPLHGLKNIDPTIWHSVLNEHMFVVNPGP